MLKIYQNEIIICNRYHTNIRYTLHKKLRIHLGHRRKPKMDDHIVVKENDSKLAQVKGLLYVL